MDTGGLAHMTYNGGYYPNPSFTAPTAGYGSRGKSAHMQKLNTANNPSTTGSIYEDDNDSNQTPRTSRSHLLAGLRTAPRQTAAYTLSAPHSQQRFGNATPNLAGRVKPCPAAGIPQTAHSTHFPYMTMQSTAHGDEQQSMYCLPEQVLAPPELHFSGDNLDQMDTEAYNNLMQQNLYLIQRQQQLQQQLVQVQAAAAAAAAAGPPGQYQPQTSNSGYHMPAPPVIPQMTLYNQQAQAGMQPIVQPIPNQPGVFSVYTPMTGQHSLYYDQDQIFAGSSPSTTPGLVSSSPDFDGHYRHGQRDSMSSSFAQRFNTARTTSPLKSSPPPQQEVAPLPPPSANAFRPGHRKSMSNALTSAIKSMSLDESKAVRTAVTGTCGPGMARAGEHPIRQPRGPPNLDELVSAPTSKHEGSKNFAARQRRRAVHDLVRASKERGVRSGSSDLGTPNSEGEINFLPSSDAGSEGRSSSPAGSNGFGTIGSGRKMLKNLAADRRSGIPPMDKAQSGYGRPSDFAAAVKSPVVGLALAEKRQVLMK